MTTNWAGNHTYPTEPLLPSSISELAALVRAADEQGQRVRAIGSRHSFNAIADADVMVSLAQLPERFEVNPTTGTVTVNGAMTYGRLAELLRPEGLALNNLASLPHISIAGAISTGTHGSGRTNGILATAVTHLELIEADGSQRQVSVDDEPTYGVGLGALGIITAVTLRTEPEYLVEQRVFEQLPWDRFLASFDQVMDCAYSVSAFTDYDAATVDQVWLKRRTDQPDNSRRLLDLGATAATEPRHPLPGGRLPHFRLDFNPSDGAEIQSEFFVAHNDGVASIEALRSIGSDLADTLMVAEIRTVAGDTVAMSPCYLEDSVAFHFTWVLDQQRAAAAAARVFEALAPFSPRAHWGKVFPPIDQVSMLYPGLGAFNAVRTSDRFVNEWVETNLQLG